jgi:hypothetical protein
VHLAVRLVAVFIIHVSACMELAFDMDFSLSTEPLMRHGLYYEMIALS